MSFASLREEFARTGYARVDPLLRDLASFDELAAEVGRVLDERGVRRDVRVGATGGTPRVFANVGRADLEAVAAVPRLYFSPALRAAIASVVDAEIAPIPYLPEQFVATRMARAGDTNGWHWDDYTYALIWVLAAPPEGAGGDLETIAGTEWNKADPRVDELVRGGPVVRRHPDAGQAYVLRADTTLHRITPLKADVRRDVLCFGYERCDRLDREVTHETVEQLYGCPPPAGRFSA